ncbi:hypothetical protein ABDX87_20010 [Pseudomonas abietaniphila]|uniref:hypothetical protein n=1 Tax=Pseudomonas abietaniphila TaxID=89065 RepID=UPI003217198B
MDELFKIATGWLGWSPSETWSAPVIEILMAWDSKRQFLIDTNPFGKPPEKPVAANVAKEVRMGFRVAAMSRKTAT